METNFNDQQASSQGPVIGIIVVIVVLIVGAFYFFARIEMTPATETLPAPQELATTSPSDETADIEADLSAENFDDIDAELGSLEAEFAQ